MKNKNTKQRKVQSTAIFWIWSTLAILLGVITGLVILIWYSPSAYKPQRPQNPEEVSVYLTHELGPDFVNQVQLEKPFELVIEQAGINDILSRQPWPQQYGEVSFADPVIFFLDQSIILMGTVKYKEIGAVISITALPEMDSQGQVRMNIQSVRLGMLPVTSLVASLAKTTVNENPDLFEGEPDLENTVEAIINNEFFDPIFWFFDYRVKATAFTLDPGVLKLTLESARN